MTLMVPVSHVLDPGLTRSARHLVPPMFLLA